MRNLFVYGTLRSAFRNPYARKLAEHASLLGPARIRGRLYHLGKYPGLRQEHGPEDWVTGEIYRLPKDPAFLEALDQYEGPQYERILTVAYRSGRPPVKTWVYRYTGPVSEAWRIESGEYSA